MQNFPNNSQELVDLIADPEAFESYVNSKSVPNQMGKDCWEADGKRGFKLTLHDGSTIRLKFFDTIKEIFNSKNVVVPGRESYLSYMDVAVMPAGKKGYSFKTWVVQHVMAYRDNKPKAIVSHAETIAKLIQKASDLGIDLVTDREASWETYFVRFK